MPNLSTKVLADMLTIDEFLHGCSNPKVERLETEVYGQGMKKAIALKSQLRCRPMLAKTPFAGRHDEAGLASPIRHHHLTRTAIFLLRVPDGRFGSALRVQEGLLNS